MEGCIGVLEGCMGVSLPEPYRGVSLGKTKKKLEKEKTERKQAKAEYKYRRKNDKGKREQAIDASVEKRQNKCKILIFFHQYKEEFIDDKQMQNFITDMELQQPHYQRCQCD